jgi:iron complex outermembrane recepter protein
MIIKIAMLAPDAAIMHLSPAMAQTDEPSSGVTDILVTAQKRDQQLQDVPVRVTLLSFNSGYPG